MSTGGLHAIASVGGRGSRAPGRQSRLAPVDLLRTILKGHIRSELLGDRFALSVPENTHAPLVSIVSRLMSQAGPCPRPRTYDFALCGEDAAAKVRRANVSAGLR